MRSRILILMYPQKNLVASIHRQVGMTLLLIGQLRQVLLAKANRCHHLPLIASVSLNVWAGDSGMMQKTYLAVINDKIIKISLKHVGNTGNAANATEEKKIFDELLKSINALKAI